MGEPNIPSAIVIRFNAKDGTEARAILETFQSARDEKFKDAQAWMCFKEPLDILNETLTKLGWPVPLDDNA